MILAKLLGLSFELDSPAATALEQAFTDGCPRTHITETFRSYADQVAIFLDRYSVRWLGSGPYNDVRWWRGRRYVRTSGLGMAAIPGTSIHGNGRAIDCNDPMRSWLREHPEYGFRFTISSEPWHAEWSPSRYTATPTPPPAPQIPTLIAPQEDDDMAAYSVHARVNPDGEWTLGHADIGSDLATFGTPVTDAMKRTVYTDGGGVVVEFRGFMATNITALGIAWARTYAQGAGRETSRPNRDDYIDIQRGLSLVAQASSKG